MTALLGYLGESLCTLVWFMVRYKTYRPLIVGSTCGNGRLCRICDDMGGILLVNESWSGTITFERSIAASLGHFIAI